MTSAANGVSTKSRGVHQLAPLAPANGSAEKAPVAQMATKLAEQILSSPQNGSDAPSKSWAEMLSEKRARQKQSSTPPPAEQHSPLSAKAMSLSADSPSSKAANATSFHYIVNAPIYYKDIPSVRASVAAVMDCCEALFEADPRRTFSVVIGLNAKEDKENTEASLTYAARKFEEEFTRAWQGKIPPPRVAGFTWKPLSRESERPINFVDFRNKTYYHEKTQEAIRAAIPDPQNCKNPTQVKLLSFDCDTQIKPEQLSDLEKRWQEKEAPLVTSGFYEFDFEGVPVALNDNPRNLQWPGFLMTCENEIDLAGKQKLAATTFETLIRYHYLNPTLPEPELRVLARRNLLVFETCNKKTKAKLVLQPLYKDLLHNLNLKKEHPEQAELLDLQINAIIRNIGKAERTYDTELRSLNGIYKMKGEQCLYPSENSLFVTLFEHNGKDAHFNVWNTTCEYAPAHSPAILAKHLPFPQMILNLIAEYMKPQKVIKLWGNGEGASEGQNIALQMRRLWRKTPHEQIQRKLVEFSWTFTTAVPPRCLEAPDWVLRKFPRTSYVLQKCGIDEPLEKLIMGFLKSRSQSSLGEHFPKQRCNFVSGLSVADNDYRYSMIPRHVRRDVTSLLFHELTQFNKEQLEAGFALVLKKIDQSFKNSSH